MLFLYNYDLFIVSFISLLANKVDSQISFQRNVKGFHWSLLGIIHCLAIIYLYVICVFNCHSTESVALMLTITVITISQEVCASPPLYEIFSKRGTFAL